MMRWFVAVIAGLGMLCLPYTFFPEDRAWFQLDTSWASNQTGHGTNGNNGNGVSGSVGNQGNGGNHGNAGGSHGGNGGGHGHGSGNGGGHGNSGSGSTGGGGGGASGSDTSAGQHGTFGGFTQHNGEGTIEALRTCTAPPTPGNGLVGYTLRQNGRFTYGGYEFAEPDFVQCMKDMGYRLETAGRNELTDFGRAGAVTDAGGI